ncbi:ABC transporter substrate-binding protein [Amycolatopsis orientalis]|uniref:ABC transporter substrate-binding protein n=1 Tax=Amycolatopsis orientalis TaxID=31958 RepID=UPI0003A4E165|nr:ABC transporter substrate-binding protein [Amycolatopsis orientalis]
MTTNRRQFLGLSLLGLAATAVGCGTATGATKTLRYQGWAGQVTPPELAADLGFLQDVKLQWVGNTISGPQDIQSAATGQVDFGGAFNGAVVKLAAANAPITSVISYYGVDKTAWNGFYVADGSPIRSPRDLVGKKVGMNTLGAHSEAMLDIYLQRNGLAKDDIGKVEPVVVPPVNTEQSLRQGQIEVGVLGDILRDKALARGGIRKLFDDYQLLGAFSAGTYVFRKDFVERNPDTVRTFVAGVGKAIEWSKSTPRAAVIERFTKIVSDRKRNEDPDALKYWTSFGVAGPGGLIQDRELQLWIDWLGSRGDVKPGSVKPADLYTNRFNPHANGKG